MEWLNIVILMAQLMVFFCMPIADDTELFVIAIISDWFTNKSEQVIYLVTTS